MKELYLDYNASAPVWPGVVRDLDKKIGEYGNPSSIHRKGAEANELITNSRKKIALELGCKAHEIVFTSGATEANNLALRGICRLNDKKNGKNKIIISSIEHPSIMETAEFLENYGFKVVKIPVDDSGLIDLNELEKEIDNKTVIVSVMHVNNIFGVIQDINKIGKMCKKKKVLFHTDAVQSFGKLKIDTNNIDMLSASGHKIGGLKGSGFLYVKSGVKLGPFLLGGGQERGIRSGTENVLGIISFASALGIQRKVDARKIEKIRDKIIFGLENLGGKINGSKKKRIWNNVHVSFPGLEGEAIVLALSEKGIYVSTGSACENKSDKEDYVLRALGLKKEEIDSGVRISLGAGVSEEDVDRLLREIKKIIN